MPTPVAHALAGMSVAWSADRRRHRQLPERNGLSALVLIAAAVAVLPDLDLLYPSIHRMMSHSITAAALVAGIAALVSHRLTGYVSRRASLICGGAYASHLLLDWLSGDLKQPPGIQLLWPFTDQWFISTWLLFSATDRTDPFTLPTIIWNMKAVFWEMLVLIPISVSSWFFRRRAE